MTCTLHAASEGWCRRKFDSSKRLKNKWKLEPIKRRCDILRKKFHLFPFWFEWWAARQKLKPPFPSPLPQLYIFQTAMHSSWMAGIHNPCPYQAGGKYQQTTQYEKSMWRNIKNLFRFDFHDTCFIVFIFTIYIWQPFSRITKDTCTWICISLKSASNEIVWNFSTFGNSPINWWCQPITSNSSSNWCIFQLLPPAPRM